MDRAQGIHGDERAVLSPERWRVQNSTPGQGGISGTGGTSGMRAVPPGLWTLRVCCWRWRCSCSACIVARICSCCAIKSDVFGLEGSFSVGTERETE